MVTSLQTLLLGEVALQDNEGQDPGTHVRGTQFNQSRCREHTGPCGPASGRPRSEDPRPGAEVEGTFCLVLSPSFCCNVAEHPLKAGIEGGEK